GQQGEPRPYPADFNQLSETLKPQREEKSTIGDLSRTSTLEPSTRGEAQNCIISYYLMITADRGSDSQRDYSRTSTPEPSTSGVLRLGATRSTSSPEPRKSPSLYTLSLWFRSGSR
ncbi:hypothetical protein BaRGS_00013814, partial [Batillaria attramentaria]